MLAVCRREDVGEQFFQIIGIQDCLFGGGTDPGRSQRSEIAVATHQNADVTEERTNSTDRFFGNRKLVAIFARGGGRPLNHRPRKIFSEIVPDTNGTGTGTTRSMRTSKCFVDIIVHHVPAKISWSSDPHDGIHVGTVNVNQTSRVMHDLGRLGNLFFKQSQRVRVGHHEDGGLIVHVPFELLQIDESTSSPVFAGNRACPFELDTFKPRHRGTGRVGSMGAGGKNDFCPRFATLAKIGCCDKQRGQFTVCPCRRLQ